MTAPRLPEFLRRHADLSLSLLIFLFAVAVNLNTATSFFVGDDFDLVKEMGGISRWTGFLTYSFWGVQEPLWWLSLGADQRIWGLNPVGYHIQNILFHALTSLLVFWLALLLTERNRLCALFSALIFITHPIHDEAIAYISGRPHAIAAAFTLLTLLLYHLFREGKGWYFLPASLLALVVSLAAKEISFTLPVLVVLYELVYRLKAQAWRKSLGRGALVAFPYFVVLGAYIFVRARFLTVSRDKLAGAGRAGFRAILDNLLAQIHLQTLGERLSSYLCMLFWPYPFSRLDYPGLKAALPCGIVLTAAALAAGLYLLYRWRRETKFCRAALFSAAALFVMLLPTFHEELGLRRRYTYFASTAFAVFVGLLVWRLSTAKIGRPFPVRGAVCSLFAAFILVNTVLLIRNNENYHRSGEIARNVIEDISRGLRPGDREITLFLFGFPRFCGGDDMNGAYLFHHTDFRSAMLLFPHVVQLHLRYVFKTSFAERFHSDVRWIARDRAEITARFDDDESFRISYFLKPGETDDNRFRTFEVLRVDPGARDVQAVVRLRRAFFSSRPTYFFRYDGGHYFPVPWEASAPSLPPG
jgi:hypothetical protein